MDGNGELLIGGTNGPAVATITAGSNITVTNSDGGIEIASSAAGAAFTTVAVSGQSNVVATGSSDTLTLVGGSGTTITTNAGTDTITINAGANTVEVDEFTGNGSTAAYTLSTTCTSENNLLVYMDGVYQHHNTYAVSGTTLTFDTNVPNGSKVEVYHMISVNISNMVQSAVAGTLMDVSASTGDVTFNVDLTEASEAAIADGDYILFLDGGATGTHAKEAIADVATLFAGTGLSASSSVISVDAAQTGITSLLATDIKIGEDDQTKIDFETADEIHFYAANVEQVYLADNIFGPQSDSDVDLGTTSVRWKDAYIDTVTTTGNAIIGGNGSSGGVTINDGSIQVRTGTGNVAEIRFYCEVSNAHYQTLKAAPHSAASSAALVLPTASGTLVGTGDTGSVSTGMIAADAITGAKIADDAIDSEHYTDGSIDTAHIADLNVTTAKIAADAITGAKIADDAIDSEHYTDGSIDTAHIADDNITFDKLENRYTAKATTSSTSGTVSIDWSAATTFEFTASLTGATTISFTNFKQGQIIGIYGLTGSQTITLDSDATTSETFNRVGTVEYDGASSNYLQIVCVDDSATAVFNYSVAAYTSDTTP